MGSYRVRLESIGGGYRREVVVEATSADKAKRIAEASVNAELREAPVKYEVKAVWVSSA